MASGARVSDAAIRRNRESSLARYHRNRDQNRKAQKAYREREFDTRPFIGWDGEGYDDADGNHCYMLFGASNGACVTGESLTTTQCLDLILEVERENPDAYHVGFAFEYDINMILRNLKWTHLAHLKEYGRCTWADPDANRRYKIEHVPHKWLRVSCDGVSATIYDAFGFFHCSYMSALHKYDVGNKDKRERIARGKAKRGHFAYADIEMVKAYWLDEISLLPPLMEKIRTAAYGGGYRISEWHGPGALATYLLRDRGVVKWHSKKDVPLEVKYAIRAAYAGGRFTGAFCGLYIGPIYTADRNSAYVWATSLLPRMDRGKWVRQNPNSVDAGNLPRFGLYHIEFDFGQERRRNARDRGFPEPPYPLFHRSKNGVLRWPRTGRGWYWTPEAALVLGGGNARVLEAWVFDDDGSYPFRFVHDAYDRRVELQHRGDPAEKAYKWALAAMYGAFARRVGWNRQLRKAPPSHELAWAGYITSHCRAAVYEVAIKAYDKGNGRGLISIDTDGITATVPFGENDLPNGVGEGLGEWKLEEWTGILQWQNGIYWLRDSNGQWKEPKSRGIPKGAIPFDAAYAALQAMDYSTRPITHPRLSLKRTHFIGYRQAIRNRFASVRKWTSQDVTVLMGGNANGKAVHSYRECYACRAVNGREFPPVDLAPDLHTISLMPDLFNTDRFAESTPHNLPWLEEQPDLPAGFVADEFKYIVKDEDM